MLRLNSTRTSAGPGQVSAWQVRAARVNILAADSSYALTVDGASSLKSLYVSAPVTYCGYMSVAFTHNAVGATPVLFVDSGTSGANWIDTMVGSFVSDSPATFRVTYTGTQTRMFHVVLTTSTAGSAGGAEYHLSIGKNGSAIAGADIQRTLGAGGTVGSITTQVCVSLAQSDTIDPQHWVSSGTPNITVEHAQLTIMPVV